MTSERFKDQTAIITGGADGLGLHIATRLVEEGARVWIVDRDQERGKAAAERIGCEFELLDVADEVSVVSAFEKIHAAAGRLDVMVNCAGIVGPNGLKIEDVSLSGFDEVQAVNVRGSFLTCREAVRCMRPRDYGRVLLIASIAGKEGNAGMSCYSTSKAGVIGLVKSVGKEYAETGITVNGLAPAVIRTAMVDKMEPAQVKYMTDKIPMKRCGTLDEVTAMACWIVSREASFNTGFTFDLSGGRAVY
ncbi:MAG: SDR family NAD(P)-dependent oxidoreductase [Verrucomicrobiales bacterium]|nr:SDR family NAD(P)-dependent oxidoreductase [Verrucomicrobiales bacterium]